MAKAPKKPVRNPRYKHVCVTKGKGRKATEFTWAVKKNSIVFAAKTKKTQGQFSSEQVIAMLAWLFGRFGYSYFPLENTVNNMPIKRARAGFGKAARLSKVVPAHTSYLGSILEDLGMLQPNDSSAKIEWKFSNGTTLKDIIGVIDKAKAKKWYRQHDINNTCSY